MNKAICICSGGLDSTVLAYKLWYEGFALHLLAFDYGQRHRVELEHAARTAAKLALRATVSFTQVDVRGVGALFAGSALTDPQVAVPHGHYAADNMRATVVPNRNAIMLSIAYGLAVVEHAECVAIGVHAGDHTVYPDCRPAFIQCFAAMETVATETFAEPDLELYAPFLFLSKADIVREGALLGVPFLDTWSCYEGGAVHCGRCGTCVERREAFQLAGVDDPTIYRD